MRSQPTSSSAHPRPIFPRPASLPSKLPPSPARSRTPSSNSSPWSPRPPERVVSAAPPTSAPSLPPSSSLPLSPNEKREVRQHKSPFPQFLSLSAPTTLCISHCTRSSISVFLISYHLQSLLCFGLGGSEEEVSILFYQTFLDLQLSFSFTKPFLLVILCWTLCNVNVTFFFTMQSFFSAPSNDGPTFPRFPAPSSAPLEREGEEQSVVSPAPSQTTLSLSASAHAHEAGLSRSLPVSAPLSLAPCGHAPRGAGAAKKRCPVPPRETHDRCTYTYNTPLALVAKHSQLIRVENTL